MCRIRCERRPDDVADRDRGREREACLIIPRQAIPQTYAIIGAAMEVHRHLGTGYLEPAYREALRLELELREVPFAAEVPLTIAYKGHVLATRYRADFVCYDSVLIEAKAQRTLTGREVSQVLNYLKTSGLQRALLVNFGAQCLEFERFVRSADGIARSSAARDR